MSTGVLAPPPPAPGAPPVPPRPAPDLQLNAPAGGLRRVVTAVIQAVVVTDLLDSRTYDELVSPWIAACGPLR